MAALAETINQEMLRRGWSVDTLIKRAGISRSKGYQLLRDGKDNVTLDTLSSIAGAFGWTSTDLLRRAYPSDRDALEEALLDTLPDLRQAVQPFNQPVQVQVVRGVLDKAVGSVRDIAYLFGQPPVIDPVKGGLNATGRPVNEDLMGPEGHLSASYGLAKMLGMAA